MADTMDPPQPSEVANESESNNNLNSDEVKQIDYLVLGEHDQELAMCQYLDDEVDDYNESTSSRNDENPEQKKLTDSPYPGEVDASPEDTSNERARVCGDIFLNNGSDTSGYMNDYDYFDSRNPKYTNGEQERLKSHHSVEPEQMRKLFIGGLDYKTSEATLKLHFEKFGDVIDCVVMREPQSKRSRGFGFVIYANSTMVDKAQEARPHEIDGREVQSKRAISREDSGKPEAQATVKKLYLGGIGDNIEESELRDYFKDFGNIVSVNIVAHRDTGRRRGFAFVEYDDYDPVDKIVLKKFHSIKDNRIEAKKAIPKTEMDARKRGDPRTAIAGAMMALSGPLETSSVRPRQGRSNNPSCLWDSGPYPGYSAQAGLDGYPPHYHSHYGAGHWMLHNGQPGGYGFRGAHTNYGRSSYAGQVGNWAGHAEYAGYPPSQGNGAGGPIRLSYQHRWGPYGNNYGSHRGRGYNP